MTLHNVGHSYIVAFIVACLFVFQENGGTWKENNFIFTKELILNMSVIAQNPTFLCNSYENFS